MTDISNQPRILTLLPVRTTWLNSLAKMTKRVFGSQRGPCEIDTRHCSEHTLRDIGALRRHERKYPSSQGFFF